jgi:Tol biopolymer transport system component/tRNA A-37 threonylcarbamoyl transferase component Bud32
MIGRTISHYRILEKLGEGGMGVVYKARDTHLDRFVAIKVLPAEKVADPERKRRFVQEAKAASALNHPNIVTIYDIDQSEGIDFIAMECIPGKSLDDLVPRKGLQLKTALKYSVQIADALTTAHAAGIVHRDLKPGNVMVTESGLVKVLDFGLAKLTEDTATTGLEDEKTLEATKRPKTEEGIIMGTASYMSPEQAEGRPVDARSDIFSLGSVLYEMVTGRKAFQGDTKFSTLTAVLREEPKRAGELVEGLPKEVERVISRCLRKEPTRRFQHMDDVRVELEELKEESDSGKLLAASAPQPVRRRSWLWAGGLLVLLAIGGAVTWLILSRSKALQVELTAVPLTTYPGMEDHPSFSPDGSQVAFVWDGEKQDNTDIYVKLIGSGGRLRLTNDPAPDYSPAWSPDGSSIAFLRDLPGGRSVVLLVPPIGGEERKLAETSTIMGLLPGSSCLSWSPDGSSLAIVDRNSPNETFQSFLLSIETGGKRKLTIPPPESVGDFFPAFSPDGRAFVFGRIGASGAMGDLFVQQLSANLSPQGEPKSILQHSQLVSNPTWTLDGREVISALGTGYYPTGLWRIRTDGSRSPQRLDFAGAQSDSPSLSRQRHRLAFTQFIFDPNLWRIELSGSRGRANPPIKFPSSTRIEANPQFSADGKKIVFLSDRSGSLEIWVCNSDGSHDVQVTSMGGPATGTPRWSPDGAQIAFDSTPDGNWDIFVVAASGGKPHKLTNQPSTEAIPSWSRDGKWVYYCIQTAEPQIWKVPAEGGKAVQVTRKAGFVAFESPDGRYLFYTKSEAGTEGLWRMPVGGGEETQVLDRTIALRSFAITNLGIYFLTTSNSEFSIQFFSFATAKTETITTVERPYLGSLTVSPDGQTILYSQFDQLGSDLMLVENFR